MLAGSILLSFECELQARAEGFVVRTRGLRRCPAELIPGGATSERRADMVAEVDGQPDDPRRLAASLCTARVIRTVQSTGGEAIASQITRLGGWKRTERSPALRRGIQRSRSLPQIFTLMFVFGPVDDEPMKRD